MMQRTVIATGIAAAGLFTGVTMGLVKLAYRTGKTEQAKVDKNDCAEYRTTCAEIRRPMEDCIIRIDEQNKTLFNNVDRLERVVSKFERTMGKNGFSHE